MKGMRCREMEIGKRIFGSRVTCNGNGNGNGERVSGIGLCIPDTRDPTTRRHDYLVFSGRDTSVPGWKVRRYRAMAQPSSRLMVPRKGGMTAPRPSKIARAIWPSDREVCQRALLKSGTSG